MSHLAVLPIWPHGLGYQPLMRDALMRFAESEKKLIMNQVLERHRLEKELAAAESAKEKKPAKRARKVA